MKRAAKQVGQGCSSSRRGWIAPGDEFRHDEIIPASAELHVGALRIRDPAAGRGDDGVPRCDIPFGGRREAWIDIGGAFRYPAELDRRPQFEPDDARPAVNKGFGPGVAMRAADRRDPGRAGRWEATGMDRLGRDDGPSIADGQPFRAAAHKATPYQSERGRADDAQ